MLDKKKIITFITNKQRSLIINIFYYNSKHLIILKQHKNNIRSSAGLSIKQNYVLLQMILDIEIYIIISLIVMLSDMLNDVT